MFDKEALCKKIIEIYPDIGACGIDINVEFDKDENRWVVSMEREGHRLRTFLEDQDAELCMNGKQCFNLGIEIAQLKDNIKSL